MSNNFMTILIILFVTIIYSCGAPAAYKESAPASDGLSTDADMVKKSEEAGATEKSKSSESVSEADAPPPPPAEGTVDGTEGESQSQTADDQSATKKRSLLTAGEWNDLENWGFWLNLMDSAWTNEMEMWKFFPINKFKVTLKNKTGEKINNATVTLTDVQGQTLWTAKTDNFGKAELWANIFGGKSNEFTIKISTEDGLKKEISKVKLADSIHNVVLETKKPKNQYLDLMFVVDATGSMSDELEFLKNEMSYIIETVSKRNNELEIRIGLVFYRDHGDDYLIRDFQFTTDLTTVNKNIAAQSAGGGGDFEEAVDEALDNAINDKKWSDKAAAKLCFLILDAPPHSEQKNIEKMQTVTKEAAENGIKIIPVVASGINKPTEFLMRFLSCSTNGTYVFLTDDSGIGNSHLAPTTGEYEVELLTDLIVRLILKYTDNAST